MATTAPPTPPPARTRLVRLLVVVVVLALVLFWLWILSGAPAKKNPDYLSDRQWVERASARCEAAVDRIAELAPAREATTPAERAETVSEANTILDRLVSELRADRPDNADDRRIVGKWLDDWDLVLDARTTFARELAEVDLEAGEEPPRLLLPENQRGDGVDRAITNFADVNNMPACGAPPDAA